MKLLKETCNYIFTRECRQCSIFNLGLSAAKQYWRGGESTVYVISLSLQKVHISFLLILSQFYLKCFKMYWCIMSRHKIYMPYIQNKVVCLHLTSRTTGLEHQGELQCQSAGLITLWVKCKKQVEREREMPLGRNWRIMRSVTARLTRI